MKYPEYSEEVEGTFLWELFTNSDNRKLFMLSSEKLPYDWKETFEKNNRLKIEKESYLNVSMRKI